MLVMKLMMRDYFRLMVGRNLSDCYIQLWESKTSRSGRPFSPSDASHHPLPRRGLTRKFVFPPSPETSSEQMRTVSRFSSSCDECFARRRRRLRCPALRASRALSLNRGPRVSGGANRKPANNLRGSSGCRSRAATTGNKEPSAAPRQCRQPCGESGDGSRDGPGARGSMRGAEPLGRSRVGPWRCTKLWARSPCAYKDMRRCPVKHAQDLPRNPKTLGHAAQQQNKLHLGTRKSTHSPQPTAHSPVTVCKSGAAREPAPLPWPSIPSDWRWDSVSGLWNNRRHQGAAGCPQPAICLAATSYPEKRLAKSCCVDHGTKRLGDLCGSTYDCHDCHERPP